MIAYQWTPIQPTADDKYDFAEIDSLHRQWLNVKSQREASSPEVFGAFIERLNRSWAIETGIIEGIYTLDRGITETLVERGISADLIESGSTNKNPHGTCPNSDHQEAGGCTRKSGKGRPLSRVPGRYIPS